ASCWVRIINIPANSPPWELCPEGFCCAAKTTLDQDQNLMKSLVLAGVAALALVSVGSVANAAQTINFGAPASDGSFTGTFGDTGITTSTFSDTYTFNMPTGVA